MSVAGGGCRLVSLVACGVKRRHGVSWNCCWNCCWNCSNWSRRYLNHCCCCCCRCCYCCCHSHCHCCWCDCWGVAVGVEVEVARVGCWVLHQTWSSPKGVDCGAVAAGQLCPWQWRRRWATGRTFAAQQVPLVRFDGAGVLMWCCLVQQRRYGDAWAPWWWWWWPQLRLKVTWQLWWLLHWLLAMAVEWLGLGGTSPRKQQLGRRMSPFVDALVSWHPRLLVTLQLHSQRQHRHQPQHGRTAA